MKRNKLLKSLKEQGAVFVKHGGEHNRYMQPLTGKVEYVPRHSDISEELAWKIIKNLSRPRG